ncbi:MAG TPA: hypothetical protein VME22_14730 [Solirubrobacteraceae bacterium]|nr:hypothetical protein [Solirubrobacteraceae bacterium]
MIDAEAVPLIESCSAFSDTVLTPVSETVPPARLIWSPTVSDSLIPVSVTLIEYRPSGLVNVPSND